MASKTLSKDQQNFMWISIACVDFIKLPLKDILSNQIKPADLYNRIDSSPKNRRDYLRKEQEHICFIPPPGQPDYNDFDVTLLYTLIRNLCSASLNPTSLNPTRGWGKEPDSSHTRIGDDIERLRLMRNKFAHANSAGIPDAEFQALWNDLKSVIQRIQTFMNSMGSNVNYQQKLADIERTDFGSGDLQKYKLFLEVTLYQLKEERIKDEQEISIKGSDKVVWGEKTCFEADLKQKEASHWSSSWQRVRGSITNQIDISKEKYRGSTRTQLVIHSVCKDDEGEYQAVLARESNGNKRKIESNAIFLHVVGDDEDKDSDNDITSRTQLGSEYLIQAIQEDISKAHMKLEELNHKHMYEERERTLEMFESEREERQQRLQMRQERKLRVQEEYQRKQRDIREKQRQDYEEQKRLMMMEEERLMKKKQEEEQKRKEMERERLRELEAQREQEEARLRAEARQRQEEQHRREIEIRERERREQEKRDQELRVREEAQRLEALRLQNQPQGYNQQYANLPAHSQYGAPAPPVRGSSYDVHGANRPNERNPEIQNGFRNMNNSNFRNVPETVPKKSVSFNTQLETRNTYSVGSESDRTPYASQSSYRSSTSDQTEPHSPYGQPPTPDHAPDNVFDSTGGTPQQNHVSYKTTEITPTVVGSQEVYRDPRNRIMAQKEAQGGSTFSKKPVSDRMSFRDKMKFFAQEAGENTPKEKPKASKTLRNIESQLHNGK